MPDLEPDDPEEDLPEEELEDEPEAPPELLEVVDLFALVLADEDEDDDPDFEDPLFWLSFLVAIVLAF